MTVTHVMAIDERPEAHVKRRLSFLLRYTTHFGWLIFALGAVWDIAYHVPTLLFAVRWPPAIDSVGEFGHVITLAGAVIIIFAILRNNERRRL